MDGKFLQSCFVMQKQLLITLPKGKVCKKRRDLIKYKIGINKYLYTCKQKYFRQCLKHRQDK